MKAFSAIINGFIDACFVTLLCIRSVTLCMNVNIGVLFLGALMLFSVLWLISLRKAQPQVVGRATVVNLAITGAIICLLYLFVFKQNIALQPSYFVSLALHTRDLPKDVCAAIPCGFLAVSVLAILRWGRDVALKS